MKLTKKQTLALDILEDNETKELAFGGGAGGGKSALGCYWITKYCLKYPGTRWLIGRAVLKTLKQTTLLTLFEIFKIQNIHSSKYSYKQQANEIHFYNGSTIILKDLFYYPSDPELDELGSLEITGAFIDEAIQVEKKVRNIVKSRIRYKLDENNLIPKILYTSNPGDGWLYDEFYEPSIKGELTPDKKFIQSLVTDNPHITKHYIEQLQTLDIDSKERLLKGNWDYESTGKVFPVSKLKRFDSIDLTNLTKLAWCDVADQGTDDLCMLFATVLDSNVYIFDAIFTGKDDESSIPLVIELLEKYDINLAYFESNGMGLGYLKGVKKSIEILDLKNETENLNKWKKRLKAIPSRGNKHSRITIQAETNILENFYFLSEGSPMYKEYIKNLTKYKYDKSVKKDDAPDATAGLSILAQKYM
jgi:predicted phage terminase large subunit-like protein